MPFVPFVNTVQVEMLYRLDGQVCENVLHYTGEAVPTETNMNTLASDIVARWNTNLKPLIHSSAALNSIRITSLQSASAPVIEYTTGLPITGTAAGNAVPNNVTVVTKLITEQRGRSFRGRIYHIGIGTNMFTGNTLVSTYRTSLRAAWLLMLNFPGTPEWSMVVASKVADGAPRTTGVATFVSGISINPTLDSQRRRLPERGL